MSQQRKEKSKGVHSTLSIALLLGVLLASIYSLTYSGTFITDDEHILTSRAISAAFDNTLNDDRVLGNSRIFAYSQLPQQQSQPSLNIEPLQALFGAALVSLSALIGTGRVQTLFLLNIFATASTGVLIFLSIRKLGYSERVAIFTTLLFGLGTQAWPYARTFFRDPLAMLFLSLAWLSALNVQQVPAGTIRWPAWITLLISITLSVLSKNTATLAIPALIYLLLPPKIKFDTVRSLFHHRYAIVISLLIVLVVIVLVVTANGIFSRFNIRYYLDLLKFFFTTSHASLLEAFLGPLVSPGKSIFIYSPVLLLSLLSVVYKKRETLAAWLFTILLILAQGLFYNQNWWGHINWGLRFFLPAVPLLMIGSAPLIESLLKKVYGWAITIGLAVLSLFIQLAGLLAPIKQYYVDMTRLSPDAAGTLGVWNINYSPILWHFRWILDGNMWNLAAARVGKEAFTVILVFIILALLALGALRVPRVRYGIILTSVLILASGWMMIKYKDDPAYFSTRSDLTTVQTFLDQESSADDLLVVASYGTPAWYYWMNWESASPSWISLPFIYSQDRSAEVPLETKEILKLAEERQQNLWMLLPCDSSASSNLLENRSSILSIQPTMEKSFQSGECTTHLLFYPIP